MERLARERVLAMDESQLRSRLRRMRNLENLERFNTVGSHRRGAAVSGPWQGRGRDAFAGWRGSGCLSVSRPSSRAATAPTAAPLVSLLQLLLDCGLHDLAEEAQRRMHTLQVRAQTRLTWPDLVERDAMADAARPRKPRRSGADASALPAAAPLGAGDALRRPERKRPEVSAAMQAELRAKREQRLRQKQVADKLTALGMEVRSGCLWCVAAACF